MSKSKKQNYPGKWSGYVVSAVVDGVTLSRGTKDGLRGTESGTATVIDGKITAFYCGGENVELK